MIESQKICIDAVTKDLDIVSVCCDKLLLALLCLPELRLLRVHSCEIFEYRRTLHSKIINKHEQQEKY